MRHRDESIRRPEIDLAIARANSAIASSAAEQTTFVFRPGGVANKNVYTDWPTLAAACTAVQGPRVIEIDGGIVNPVHIPAGTWNFGNRDDVTLVGTPGTAPFNFNVTTLIFDDGAHLSGIGVISRLNMTQAGATPTITIPTGANSLLYLGQGSITTSGTAPFLQADDGGFALVITHDGFHVGTGTAPVFFADGVTAFTVLAFFMLDLSMIDMNTLGKTAALSALSVQIGSSAALFATAQAAALPGGTVVPIIKYRALLESAYADNGAGSAFPGAVFTPICATIAMTPGTGQFIDLHATCIIAKDAAPGSVNVGLQVAGQPFPFVTRTLGFAALEAKEFSIVARVPAAQITPLNVPYTFEFVADASAGGGTLGPTGATMIAYRSNV